MPTLEHRVSQLSPTALYRRQERARRLIHTLATVEPGLIGLELKRERLALARRLHAAAEEGRDGDMVAIQAALTRNREQMLRLAGFPLPARPKAKSASNGYRSSSQGFGGGMHFPEPVLVDGAEEPLDADPSV